MSAVAQPQPLIAHAGDFRRIHSPGPLAPATGQQGAWLTSRSSSIFVTLSQSHQVHLGPPAARWEPFRAGSHMQPLRGSGWLREPILQRWTRWVDRELASGPPRGRRGFPQQGLGLREPLRVSEQGPHHAHCRLVPKLLPITPHVSTRSHPPLSAAHSYDNNMHEAQTHPELRTAAPPRLETRPHSELGRPLQAFVGAAGRTLRVQRD